MKIIYVENLLYIYIYVNVYVETSLDELILYIFLCEMPELGTTYLTIMK